MLGSCGSFNRGWGRFIFIYLFWAPKCYGFNNGFLVLGLCLIDSRSVGILSWSLLFVGLLEVWWLWSGCRIFGVVFWRWCVDCISLHHQPSASKNLFLSCSLSCFFKPHRHCPHGYCWKVLTCRVIRSLQASAEIFWLFRCYSRENHANSSNFCTWSKYS